MSGARWAVYAPATLHSLTCSDTYPDTPAPYRYVLYWSKLTNDPSTIARARQRRRSSLNGSANAIDDTGNVVPVGSPDLLKMGGGGVGFDGSASDNDSANGTATPMVGGSPGATPMVHSARGPGGASGASPRVGGCPFMGPPGALTGIVAMPLHHLATTPRGGAVVTPRGATGTPHATPRGARGEGPVDPDGVVMTERRRITFESSAPTSAHHIVGSGSGDFAGVAGDFAKESVGGAGTGLHAGSPSAPTKKTPELRFAVDATDIDAKNGGAGDDGAQAGSSGGDTGSPHDRDDNKSAASGADEEKKEASVGGGSSSKKSSIKRMRDRLRRVVLDSDQSIMPILLTLRRIAILTLLGCIALAIGTTALEYGELSAFRLKLLTGLDAPKVTRNFIAAGT